MIPIIYENNETAFISNGLGRLPDCLSITVNEELSSGLYECDFTYPVTGTNYDLIQLGRTIVVTHDDTGDAQPFDIVSYSRPIDGIVSFHAVHISYRLTKYVTFRYSTTGVNSVSQALQMFNAAMPTPIPFSFSASGLTTTSGFMGMTVDNTPRSVRELIGGGDGCFLSTYNAEVIWDKFNVNFVGHRGQQRDFAIRYGVNLIGYNEDTDGSNTFTTCIPFWKSGDKLVLGGLASSGLIPYDGRQNCVPLDLSSRFETAPTVQQLQAEAISIMQTAQTNLPKRSIEVDFIRLQDLEGYADYANLLTCGLGDTIKVVFPDYNIESTFRIVKIVWNALQDRYESMTLGVLETTLSEALGVSGGNFAYTVSGGGGGGSSAWYGTCTTAAATAAKETSIPGFSASNITTGQVIYIYFSNANGVASPTLNINSTGANAIKRYGSTAPGTSAGASWNAGSVVCLIYDGTNWVMQGWLNTTYSGMTDAEYQAGTGTSNRLITPARLKNAIEYYSINGITSADVTTALGFNPVSRTAICYANSRVDSFSNGQINVTNTSLGVTTGAKPVGILLTPSSSTVTMRYHYDGSDATNSNIRAYNLDGTGFNGNLRYFCVVFQNSWTTT